MGLPSPRLQFADAVNSGFKANDHAVLYDGQFRVLFSVQSITDFGRRLENATAGWIESDAEAGIRKNAISGWKDTTGSPDILNSEAYTTRVLKLAEKMSFTIPRHRFDNGWKPVLPHQFGRFNACHIEKKLALWWVEKVLLFCLKTKELSRMNELSGFEVPARMARATVVLNHAPCKNVGLVQVFISTWIWLTWTGTVSRLSRRDISNHDHQNHHSRDRIPGAQKAGAS